MAMASMGHSSSVTGSSSPVRVALIGHSYVRRLQEYCEQQLRNLGFPCQDTVVRAFCRGGATVRLIDDDRWINCQLQPALGCRPAIVFLHIGENDILHLDAEVLSDHLWALVQYIRVVANPCVIILSQLLWFPAYEDHHEKISWVNYCLQKLVEESHLCLVSHPLKLSSCATSTAYGDRTDGPGLIMMRCISTARVSESILTVSGVPLDHTSGKCRRAELP